MVTSLSTKVGSFSIVPSVTTIYGLDNTNVAKHVLGERYPYVGGRTFGKQKIYHHNPLCVIVDLRIKGIYEIKPG